MFDRGVAWIWWIAIVASGACSGTPTGRAAATQPVASRPAKADALAKSLDDYYSHVFPADEPGGEVLVMKNDQIVFARGYGLADVKTHEKVTTRTLFNLGSISKTFVANAVLILAEQHKLSVDDPIGKYFPEFKNKDIAARVKLRHLLTHTSGLPDNRDVRSNVEFFLTARDAENWHPITQADKLEFEPGSQFEYSNPAFNGLALIVEQVSGMKWQRFVHDKIFGPAGMSTSTITDGPYPETGVAHGYTKGDFIPFWLELDYGEVPTFAAAGNGGVWSSVEELAAYERALEAGVFLPPAVVADSRTVKTFDNWTSAEPPRIGWSWFIKREPNKPVMVGHTGSQGGFTATYMTFPDKHLLFVMLANAEREDDAYGKRAVELLEQVGWLDD